MILERAGYKVIAIANPDQAARIFSASSLDAVVFGDSIQADQRNDLARTFKRLNPSVPIIALSQTSGSQVPSGIVDEQLESLGDPQLLLEALKRVLARDGDGSASSHATPAPESDGDAGNAASGNGKAIADRTTDPKASKKSAV
jgi:DNA-binding NtrC family response regulator